MIRARNVGVWTQRIAIAAVVALVVGFAVRVGSTSSQSLSFRDPLVWLASVATGEVVQADSGSGEVTARVDVGSANDSLDVLQHGPDALVLNRTTGELSRVNGATLAVSASAPVGADATAVLVGRGDHARVVTATQVIPVDVTSGALGTPVDLEGLAAPVVDSSGTVWGLGEGRQLIAVDDAVTEVATDSSTRPFALVDANGEAYLLDGAGPDLRLLNSSGPAVGGSYCVGGSMGAGVVAGGSVESGRVIVMVDPATGTVRMNDRLSDRCTSVVLDEGAGERYGRSVESGGFAFIPVISTGEVVVVRVAEGSVVSRTAVTTPGHPIDLVVKDGTVWFNDPMSAAAGVLGSDGVVRAVDKYRQLEVGGKTEQANPTGTPSVALPQDQGAGSEGSTTESGTSGQGGSSADSLGSNSSSSGPVVDGELSGLIADFVYSKGVVEVGEEVTFADRSQGGPTAWTWDFGDGEFSTGPNAAHSWAEVGAYKVTLRIESAEGSAAATATIEVIDENTRTRPNADFRYSASRVEVGQSVQFTDRTTGNPQTLEWDFGDGTTAEGEDVEHSWSSAGTYSVALTATNALGRDTSEPVVITVYDRVEKPTAAIDASPTRAGVNQTITFTSRSTGNPTSFRWDFGDGSPGTGETVTHSYITPGRYTVTLYVSNSAGDSQATVDVTIDATVVAPVARIAASTTSTEIGQQVRFTSLSINNPDRLTWDFGDGSDPESGSSVTHTFRNVGTYRVSLVAENGAGVSRDEVTVTVVSDVPAPVAAFDIEPASPVRAGQSVRFNNRSTGVISEYQWSWGDGTPNSSQKDPTHVFQTDGTYTVRLTVSNTAGPSHRDMTIRVLPPVPRAGFSWTPTVPNAGQQVQFTDRSSGTGVEEWLWEFPDGSTSRQQNPTFTFRERGRFAVRLTVSNAGGPSEPLTQWVEVNPQPPQAAFDMTPASGITTDHEVELRYRPTTGGEPDSYVWTFSDGSRPKTGPVITHRFSAGSQTVTLTVNNASRVPHEISRTFTVAVPPPTARFTVGERRVAGLPITLTNTSTNATRYSWSAPGATFSPSATAMSPTVTFAEPVTNVTITLTATNADGVERTFSERIRVWPQPTASITPPTGRVVAGTPVTFQGTATGGDAMWSYSGPASGEAADGRFTFPTRGTYTVRLVVTNAGGGRAEATPITVEVDPPRPVAVIDAAPGNANGRVILRNASTVGGPFENGDVTWEFDDGRDPDTGNQVTHDFDGERPHTVTMTVRNITGSHSTTVTIPARPTASFTAIPPPNLLLPSIFAATTTGGDITDFEWLINGERIDENGATFSRSFPAGEHTVQLRVRNLWGWSEPFSRTYTV